MEFKDRLKSLRVEKGVSTTALAAEFGRSDAAVRMWEIGKSKPDVDTLITLAVYFDCTTDYLLGLSNSRNAKEYKASNLTLDDFSDRITKIKGGLQFVRKLVRVINAEDAETTILFGTRTLEALYFAVTAVNEIKNDIKSGGDVDSDLMYDRASHLLKCRMLFSFAVDELYSAVTNDVNSIVERLCCGKKSKAFGQFETLFRLPDAWAVRDVNTLIDELERKRHYHPKEATTNADET